MQNISAYQQGRLETTVSESSSNSLEILVDREVFSIREASLCAVLIECIHLGEEKSCEHLQNINSHIWGQITRRLGEFRQHLENMLYFCVFETNKGKLSIMKNLISMQILR